MMEYLTPMGPTPLHVNPIFEIGPMEPRFSEWLVFEGISVDESGRQHYLDASVAYKRAVLNAIDYLSRFGYSKEQVNSSAILPRVASLVHRLLIEAASKHAGLSVALVLPLWGKDLGNRRQPECCCHPRHSHCHIRSGDLFLFLSDPCSSPNDDDDEDNANRISDRRRGRCPPVLESWRGTPMSLGAAMTEIFPSRRTRGAENRRCGKGLVLHSSADNRLLISSVADSK